jgi:hypothetical protein
MRVEAFSKRTRQIGGSEKDTLLRGLSWAVNLRGSATLQEFFAIIVPCLTGLTATGR